MKKSTLWSILSALVFLSACSASALDISFERDTSLPIVQINVAIRTGAVSDPANELGITNFMGEMLLRGTDKLSKEQIDLALDQMGAQLGVETRSEALIIRGAVLSSQLDRFLSLLQELITQSNFPQQEIEKLQIRRRIPDSRGGKQRPDPCGAEVHRISFRQPSLRKTDSRKDKDRPSLHSR